MTPWGTDYPLEDYSAVILLGTCSNNSLLHCSTAPWRARSAKAKPSSLLISNLPITSWRQIQGWRKVIQTRRLNLVVGRTAMICCVRLHPRPHRPVPVEQARSPFHTQDPPTSKQEGISRITQPGSRTRAGPSPRRPRWPSSFAPSLRCGPRRRRFRSSEERATPVIILSSE